MKHGSTMRNAYEEESLRRYLMQSVFIRITSLVTDSSVQVVYNLLRAFENNVVQGPPFDGRYDRRRANVEHRRRTASGGL